jgi:hypothetical protein
VNGLLTGLTTLFLRVSKKNVSVINLPRIPKMADPDPNVPLTGVDPKHVDQYAFNKAVSVGGMAVVGSVFFGPFGAAIGAAAGYYLADPIVTLVDKIRTRASM